MAQPKQDIEVIFDDFSDYWHYAHCLSSEQRSVIFESLPVVERRKIEKSYAKGGWEDLFARDTINEIIDEFKSKYHYDLLEFKSQIIQGKSIYLKKDIWDELIDELSKFDSKHLEFVLGGVKWAASKSDKNVVVLLPPNEEE